MKRAFTVIEGEGKGTRQPLESPVILVGRSSDADIKFEDLKVSRRHLEVRVDRHGVWVTNRSDKGSVLNGSALVGTVSLNDGDILEIGDVKLRYDEIPNEQAEPSAPKPQPQAEPERRAARPDIGDNASKGKLMNETKAVGMLPDDRTKALEDSISRTKAVGSSSVGKDNEPARDATRVHEEDRTRIMDPDQLGPWQPQKVEASGWAKLLRFVFALLVIGGAAGATFWYQNTGQPKLELMPYKEPSGKFTINYPSDWPKISEKSDLVIYGSGDEKTRAWVQLRISVESDAAISLTGLTDGFKQYADGPFLQQYKDVRLDLEKDAFRLNDVVTAVLFRFGSSNVSGLGIYVLDGDTRMIIEGVGAPGYYEKFDPLIQTILRGFSLQPGEYQEFIDFPMPDAIMRTEATGSPKLQEQNITEHMRLGETLLAAKDVKPENLYRARQEYREAARWCIARVDRLKDKYREAATGLRQAEKLFDQALEDQRFRIKSARAQNDYVMEQWAAYQMMQMVPDKSDPAYQEANRVWRALEKMKERR